MAASSGRRGFLAGITRNIVLLGLVSLCTDLGSQMITPVLPLFLTSVLGAGAAAVGIVEGAAQAAVSLLNVVSGYISDKVGKRKPLIFAGYSLSSLAKPLFAFAQSWPFVLIVRVSDRVGKGIRGAPRDAVVAESCDVSVRGKAFGLQRMMDGLGSVLGACLALLLLGALGYRKLFLIAFIPGILSVLLILLVRETGKGANANAPAPKLAFRSLSGNLRLYIIIAAIFALADFGYAFLILKAKSLGLSDSAAILLYILYFLAYTVCATPTGALSDRIGRKPVIMAGYLLFAACALGLALSHGIVSLVIFFMLYGVYNAFIDGTQRAFVVDLAPANVKATALGAFNTAVGIVAMPAGFIAGTLWDRMSPAATFTYGLCLALVSVALFHLVKEKP